ncbi:MAG TPA: hypothetical protein VF414_07080, partial [Thermoanaerobaculia bacterium]
MSDELRSILKKGDPAAGDPGLTPEEIQGMRRVVLAAVPEPRRRGWLVPVLAGAAALILAVALILWRPESAVVEALRPPAVRPPLPLAGEGRGEGSVVAEEKTPPHRPSAGLPASQEREPPPSPRKKTVRSEPEPVVVAQAEPPAVPEAPAEQQIQFSTPGGTRVI